MNNTFEKFAEQRLKEHTAELNTSYRAEQLPKEEKQKALEDHMKLFKQELEEHIGSTQSDAGSKQQQHDLAEQYVQQLKQGIQ